MSAMSLRYLSRPRWSAFQCIAVPRLCPFRSFSKASLVASSQQVTSDESKASGALPPRWLSELKQRIGKCIIFGLKPEQVWRAGYILDVLAKEWRDLLAGSEGFLTGKNRAGLERQNVVWGEMDSMQHVNNVTYTRYAESARINWALNFAVHIDPEHKKEWSELWTPRGTGLILRSIRTDYKFPMTWPDKVSVYHKLRSPPSPVTDSFILDVIVLSEKHQRIAARCEEDIVVYDYRESKKTALKQFMVEKFQETHKLQEETKKKSTARVLDLMRRVEALENESWNRKDAQEDLGSAS